MPSIAKRIWRSNVFAAMAAMALSCHGLFAAMPAPVVWYDMEELNASGKVPDKSGNSRDLTIGAGCSLVETDRQSKGLNFDGTTCDSYAKFSCPALTERTISLWFKRGADDGTYVWGDATTNTFPHLLSAFSRFRFHYTFNKTDAFSIYYGSPEEKASLSGLTVGKGEWTHLAFTIKALTGEDAGKSVVAWYKNGRLIGSYTGTGQSIDAAQTACLGNNTNGGPRPVNGVVDDLRIYDVALTDEQILHLATLDNPSDPQLIAAWDFNNVQGDAGSARTAQALTGYASDLSLEADVALTNGVVAGTQSLWFNGTANTIVTGLSRYPFVTLDVTVAGWVRHSEEAVTPVQEGNKFNRAFGLPNGMIMQLNVGDKPADTITYYQLNGSSISVSGMRSGYTGWSHFAISEHVVYDETADTYTCQPVFYCNGELVTTGAAYTVAMPAAITYGSSYYLGSCGSSYRSRVLHGGLDDFRVYAGILDGTQVRELFRGAAAPDAGTDFSVAGSKAVLRGNVASAAAETGLKRGYAGICAWTQVSGPEATIANPASERTEVNLPEAGEYVFRLTVTTGLGDARHDDVTVRRVAPTAGKLPPTVAIQGTPLAAELPVPLALSATASDPDGADIRLVWSRVSGPGTVDFSPPSGAATKATFSAAGTYVVRCTAENADVSASADATVTVTDSGISAPAFLSDGLIHYWSFDNGTPWADKVNGTVGSYKPNVSDCRPAEGISGNGVASYAIASYFETGGPLQEEGTAGEVPTDQWRSFSLWMWHDPDQDVSVRKEVSLISAGGSFGIRYNCENDTDGFTLYHQTLNGVSSKAIYPRPAVDPKGRWTHVVAVMDRQTAKGSNESELWVDGVKQVATSGELGPSRKRTDNIRIGGMETGAVGDGNSGSYADAQGNALWRTFPGVIDEVRIYSRKLSAAEIKWLAAHPRVEANEGLCLDGLPTAIHVMKGFPKTVGPAIISNGNVTYRWFELDGAEGLALDNVNQPACCVTGRTLGMYRLVLEVSDGERTTRSDPITVEVVHAGTVLIFR